MTEQDRKKRVKACDRFVRDAAELCVLTVSAHLDGQDVVTWTVRADCDYGDGDSNGEVYPEATIAISGSDLQMDNYLDVVRARWKMAMQTLWELLTGPERRYNMKLLMP